MPRSRFAPVKSCDDLLLAWSDAYVLQENYRLCPNPARKVEHPSVRLDPAYYSTIDRLLSRFPHGAPSLVGCEAFSVTGDVRFGRNVVINGAASIINNSSNQESIEDNAVVAENRVLGQR